MLSWASILYGAALSSVAAGAALTALARPPASGHPDRRAGRRRRTAGLERDPARHPRHPVLHRRPLRLLPASWQDTGSGVFALAATAVLLGVGALAEAPTRRTIGLAVLCGLAAFLVDVYLY